MCHDRYKPPVYVHTHAFPEDLVAEIARADEAADFFGVDDYEWSFTDNWHFSLTIHRRRERDGFEDRPCNDFAVEQFLRYRLGWVKAPAEERAKHERPWDADEVEQRRVESGIRAYEQAHREQIYAARAEQERLNAEVNARLDAEEAAA